MNFTSDNYTRLQFIYCLTATTANHQTIAVFVKKKSPTVTIHYGSL